MSFINALLSTLAVFQVGEEPVNRTYTGLPNENTAKVLYVDGREQDFDITDYVSRDPYLGVYKISRGSTLNDCSKPRTNIPLSSIKSMAFVRRSYGDVVGQYYIEKENHCSGLQLLVDIEFNDGRNERYWTSYTGEESIFYSFMTGRCSQTLRRNCFNEIEEIRFSGDGDMDDKYLVDKPIDVDFGNCSTDARFRVEGPSQMKNGVNNLVCTLEVDMDQCYDRNYPYLREGFIAVAYDDAVGHVSDPHVELFGYHRQQWEDMRYDSEMWSWLKDIIKPVVGALGSVVLPIYPVFDFIGDWTKPEKPAFPAAFGDDENFDGKIIPFSSWGGLDPLSANKVRINVPLKLDGKPEQDLHFFVVSYVGPMRVSTTAPEIVGHYTVRANQMNFSAK